jgi:protein involved in polysaccharide export with SLBB domain
MPNMLALPLRLARGLAVVVSTCCAFAAQAQTTTVTPSAQTAPSSTSAATTVAVPPPAPPAATSPTGSVQLREATAQPSGATRSIGASRAFAETVDGAQPLPPPSEFEDFVNRLAGATVDPGSLAALSDPLLQPRIRRLGSDLIASAALRSDPVDYNPLVPPDYLIASGDEIVLTLWGSVDADLRLFVDRSGRITVPRVGAIMVSGVRYADLPAVIARRVAQVFRNFELSVSLGQLRGVRVYVTGFVARPGAYTMNSLSSVAAAVVRAGGPSGSGSFRRISLRRGGAVVAKLDFYDLLLNGDRRGDMLLQAEDVVHIGPIGAQVAAIGSVNRPAIYELVENETVADVLRMAGGTSPVANTSQFALERMDERTTTRVVQVPAAEAASRQMQNGDVLRVFNAVTVASPIRRQNKRVRIEGEVFRPGDYILPADSTIADALRTAGGLTPGAFVFGTDFTRESVRLRQQENYERALRDLEVEIARATTTQRVSTADEAAALNSRTVATARLLERLRGVRPSGRVVLQIAPDGRELPNLVLEDGDRLLVPPVPTSIGVFGSVFNAGNYLREDNRTLADYLRQAGGPTRGADAASTFVIRANGTVVSGLQSKSWLGGTSTSFEQLPALPGDTLFVPEQLDKTTLIQDIKDWTQILSQFSLGVAAFVTLTN